MYVKTVAENYGVGIIFTLNALIVLSLSLPISVYLINDTRVKYAIYIGCFLLGLCFFTFWLSTTLVSILIAIVFISLGEVVFFPSADTLMSLNFPLKKLGTSLGMVQIGYTVGGIIGTTLGGYLYDTMLKQHTENNYWLGISCVVVACVILIGMISIYYPKPDIDRETSYSNP